MAERVAAGLRPHRQSMRLQADCDGFHQTARRIDIVDDIVPPSRQPELLSVDADIAHVGAAAAGNRPDVLDLAGCKVDDSNAPPAVRHTPGRMRAAIGDVELLAVAARVETVRADAGRNEIGLNKAVTVYDIDAVGVHIGNVEAAAVGRNADVLRHTPLCEAQIAEHLAANEVDLDQSAAAELAGEDRVAPVDREIGMVDPGAVWGLDRLLQRHRIRIAKIEALAALGNDDRRLSVWREVQIVGVVDGNGVAGLAGLRIDRRQTTAGAAVLGVVRNPQGLQIP